MKLEVGSLVYPKVFSFDKERVGSSLNYNFIFLFSEASFHVESPVYEWAKEEGPALVLEKQELGEKECSIKVFISGKTGWVQSSQLENV